MTLRVKNIFVFSVPLLLLFNEYIVYYLILFSCNWPSDDQTNIMLLSDTHLLGVHNGHWFDKLRRLVEVIIQYL